MQRGLRFREAANQLVRVRPTFAETPQALDGPRRKAIHTNCESLELIAGCLSVRVHREEEPAFTLAVPVAPVPESTTL